MALYWPKLYHHAFRKQAVKLYFQLGNVRAVVLLPATSACRAPYRMVLDSILGERVDGRYGHAKYWPECEGFRHNSGAIRLYPPAR